MPNFTAYGISSFNSAALNENQFEQTYFGVAALQRSINGADVQVSYFTRYSSVHFVPDAIGDIIFNGVASDVFRSDIANGVSTDAAYRLNEAHTLRGGFLVRTDLTDVANTNTLSGRVRLAAIPDNSAASLHAFIRANVRPGATLLTDGHRSYPGLSGYRHDPRTVGK